MEEAKSLGLEPHPNTGELKLQTMINDELSKAENGNEEKPYEPDVNAGVTRIGDMAYAQRIGSLRKKQMKLVRVVVRCNNENKKEWGGEIHTIICAAGTIKKWVPFDNEKGWHVPQCIIDVMREKTCQKFKSGKLPNGQEHKVSYSVREYTIEVLDPLTKSQLKGLASEQAARGSIK